ncbi:MAG: hypothetical protein LBG59_08760 [Candidatus Peribacteria bacterium]|jgi:hypothetical protein|nr:hypothetical protein [Candidatus Peribacteria bacterium]
MAREITKEELFEWVDPNLRKWANNFFQKDFTLRRLDPNAQMLISLRIFESLSKDHLTQIIQKTTLATNKQEVARNLVKPLIEDVNFKKHLRTEIDKFKQVIFLSQKELITALYDKKRGLTSGYIPEIYTPLEKIPQPLEKAPQQLEEKNREKEEQKKLFLQNIHTAIKEIEDHKKT